MKGIDTKDSLQRIEAGRQSLLAFGWIYFAEYFTHVSPEYQKGFAKKLQDDNNMRIAECDFRESGKSVLATLIDNVRDICYNKRHFIIVGSETSDLAAVHLSSVINALESNELIVQDFGNLYVSDSFADTTVSRKKTVKDFITTNNVRMMAKGRGDKVRGLRHLKHRPDKFVGDDTDSLNSTKNMEQRDKAWNWIKSEVFSGMNQEYGKAIIVGNMIHFDCVMARCKKDKTFDYGEVPIHDKRGNLSWPERHFWTKAEAEEYNKKVKFKEDRKTSIEAIKEDKGSLVFGQEYLLVPMTEGMRLINPAWIKYYDELPRKEVLYWKARIDPSAKEKEQNDYSAIIVGCRDKNTGKIYIVDGWQDRCSEKKKKDKAWHFQQKYPDIIEFGVEDNAYQEVLRQGLVEMKDEGKYIPAIGLTTTKDKTMRTMKVQPYIERGDVLFNPKINELTLAMGDQRSQGLIDQATQFPLAPHDDVWDACMGVIERLLTLDELPKQETDKEDKPHMAGIKNKRF